MVAQGFLNIATITLLLTFAFVHQCVHNREEFSNRINAISLLFHSEDSGVTKLEKDVETLDDFKEVFEDLISAYYDAPRESCGTFMHFVNGLNDPSVQAPQLHMMYHAGYYGSPDFHTVKNEVFNLTEDNLLGPFANPRALIGDLETCSPLVNEDNTPFISCRGSSLGELMDRMVLLKLTYQLRSLRTTSDGVVTPGVWKLEYDFALSGHNSVLTITGDMDVVEKRNPRVFAVLVTSAILALTMVCILERVRRIPRFSLPLSSLFARDLESMSFVEHDNADDEDTVNWLVLGFLSDAVVVTFCICSLANQFGTLSNSSLEEAVTLLLAFSVMTRGFLVVTVMRFFPENYVVVDAFFTAMQQLSMYAIAVFPILLGYAICGTAIFSGYGGFFNSIPSGLVTLVCAVFGDNLIDTFIEIDQSTFWLQLLFSRLFITSFIVVFICSILNIAHSVVQDSYALSMRMLGARERAKLQRRLHKMGLAPHSVDTSEEQQLAKVAAMSTNELQTFIDNFTK